jgi:putative ABC transport system permease protein
VRRRRRGHVPERSRLCLRDLASESLAGIAQRPGRSLLTVTGTILGTCAFVVVLGLTATVGGQIGKEFSILAASTVSVNDAGSAAAGSTALDDFPANSDALAERLNGVIKAGVWWNVQLTDAIISTSPDARAGSSTNVAGLPLYAASAGGLEAMQATVRTGELFNEFDVRNAEPVVVLGSAAASELGITNLTGQPVVFINGIPFTVVGVISAAQRVTDLLSGLIVPTTVAEKYFGPPQSSSPPQMVIWTRLGAADQVAQEVPVALRPDDRSVLQAVAPPDKWALQGGIDTSLQQLFLALAGLTLLVGAVGIANTTLVAVLERTPEIGLRRSLGARPVHVTAQVLCESGVLGFLGGLIGSSVAVLAIVVVSLSKDWTAILDVRVVLAAPLVGAATGLLAGLYPATRASRIEPLEALRS